MASWTHLADRFWDSLRPGPPKRGDEQWARTKLSEGERTLWVQMSNPDRRHAVAVAQRAAAELGGAATRPVLAAALLHDVGKIVSGLRTPGRVAATLFWSIAPSSCAHVSGSGWRLRLNQYHLHPELGEALLVAAGADPITSGWAADHHRRIEEWRIDPPIGRVLKACDGD